MEKFTVSHSKTLQINQIIRFYRLTSSSIILPLQKIYLTVLSAKSLSPITDEDITIIKHARKSLLFSSDKPWVKRNNHSMFDVTMGSYDETEVCKLVRLFILNILRQTFGKENVGLYRDDGLMIVVFQQLGLKITAEIDHQVINFLDITLNLHDGKFSSY